MADTRSHEPADVDPRKALAQRYLQKAHSELATKETERPIRRRSEPESDTPVTLSDLRPQLSGSTYIHLLLLVPVVTLAGLAILWCYVLLNFDVLVGQVIALPTGILLYVAISYASAVDTAAVAPELAPVHQIHVNALREAKEKFKEYTETAASPVEIECQLGPARLSEFTAKSPFGTALHGYRGTIIGHERGVTVYCSSPESDWQALKPTFHNIFATPGARHAGVSAKPLAADLAV